MLANWYFNMFEVKEMSWRSQNFPFCMTEPWFSIFLTRIQNCGAQQHQLQFPIWCQYQVFLVPAFHHFLTDWKCKNATILQVFRQIRTCSYWCTFCLLTTWLIPYYSVRKDSFLIKRDVFGPSAMSPILLVSAWILIYSWLLW